MTAATGDIRGRKGGERHLAQMEGRYRGLLEAAPDAMVVVNQAGEIVLLNVQAEKQFGYRRDELLGQKVKNIIPEGFAERLISDSTRTAAEALAQQIGTGIELVGRRKDGSEFPIEIMLSPLESAEGILVTAAIRDISVRKEAERHLAQMEGRYRGLLEAAPDAMVVVNQAGEIVLLNVQAEKRFGYRRDELLGQKVKNIIPEGFAERLISDSTRTAAAALAQQIGTGIELVGRRKDGSEFPIEIMLSPLESAEGILVTAAIRDISERRSAKEQLNQAQKMEAVGQLTGGLAHDFNNLLAIIVGGLDLLAERLKNDEEGRKLVEVALSAGLRGAELTRKLLAFSRKQALETKAVDANGLVRDTMEMLRRSLGENIEVDVNMAGDLWPVDTDPAQFESALVNLAVNSRDAMPDGGHLTIETANSQLDEQYAAENPDVAPGDYMMLSVTDNGIGISPEHLNRVIEPFFTTKAIGKGSGLGLSMIYGFARQSGGHLKIYSEVGHGTTARLYLPRGKARPEMATAPTAQAAEPVAASELILVVDDNAEVRAIVVAQLATLGYHTLEAVNGASAIDLLKATPGVDLLLTDIVMPGGMSGVQLGEAARQIRPEIRILYTSGFTEASVRNETAKAIAAGQLLSKPYRKSELAEKVRKVLSRV